MDISTGGSMDVTTIERTRRALHALAETVLAGPQYRASGTIRLRARPGGFGTVLEPALRVDGAELVAGDRRVPLRQTTCAAVGRAAGVDAGAPEGLYHDGPGVGVEEVIDVDPDAARWIAACFAAGDAALRRLAPDHEPVLWPEHFDIAVRMDGVNYGVSAGDGFHPEPYAYVGPDAWPDDDFWDAPFGAYRPMRTLGDADSVLAFFQEGRRRASADPPATRARPH